jgi:hypothetical protein
MAVITNLPMHVRRDDDPRDSVVTLQQMIQFLRDSFDTFQSKFQNGTSTITSGNTTVAVSFPASLAGTFQVEVTPLANPGGAWWVSGKGAGGFTINLAVAAPVSGVAFDWVAKGA